MRSRLFSVVYALVLCCGVALAQTPAGGTQVESTGLGAITYNDIPAARDRAMDDAKRKAVEFVLGTLIDSRTRVENYQVMEDQILSWTRGYVRNYKILSEGKTAEDMYEVKMLATVDQANISRDVEAVQNLLQSMGNPRVMFLFDEQNIGEAVDRYHFFQVDMTATETSLMNKFLEKNFQVVDPGTVRQNKERDAVVAAINGDSKAAASIAAALDAEVVITGKAVAKVASGVNLGGMKSCQASITARVIDADVGTVIATSSKSAAYPHIDEMVGGTKAIEKAANLLGDELIARILEKWRSRVYSANSVKLLVTGLNNYNEAANFRGALSFAARGIKAVTQRNLAGNTAEYEVQIQGNADQLARELDQRVLANYSLAVQNVTANKIMVKLVHAEPSPAPEQLPSGNPQPE
ncbi:MAG TPA: hypothetical protein PLN61_16190 [bacterium]|nr:hypothetical protein [bacterium]HQI50191.1 hypothetical protein [bacterium]HQJ64829.1 hypothetical protein [bacterium]